MWPNWLRLFLGKERIVGSNPTMGSMKNPKIPVSELIYEPRINILGATAFSEPDHLKVNWEGEATELERMVEYAGRVCYMSYHNPAKRTTDTYISNILKQKHYSVLEHSNITVLIEGVSRSLTHELVRHRHLSFSQLSQRYVDESECSFVIPPAIIEDAEAFSDWYEDIKDIPEKYKRLSDRLYEKNATITEKTLRRKVAREAARSVLPNCTETKLVVTGNIRAWRDVLVLRGSTHAEREIRRLAVALLKQFKYISEILFSGFEIYTAEDGLEAIKVT